MEYKIIAIIFILFIYSCNEGADINIANEMNVQQSQSEYSILIFSKTDGFRHDSIETGREVLTARAIENGYIVTATENSKYFTYENIKNYDVIIFLNTTQTVLEEEQKTAFKSYIRNGGGFVGIHSATDTEYEWSWYNKLVGAYFESHPRVQPATVIITNSNHPSTIGLDREIERTDEWYNFKSLNEDVIVLLELDPDSFDGSNHPDSHPIAWYHEFDGGRVFYTGGGHTIDSYYEDFFMDHLWGGINYAMGLD